MFKPFWTTVLWVLISAWAAAAGVREGMTRAEVEAEAGKPLSVLTRGDTLVMRYPNDGRVELVEGKVVRVVRVRHADDPLTPAEQAAADAEREKAEADRLAKAEAEAEARAAAQEAREATADQAVAAGHAKAEAEARRKLEESVERLSSEHEAGAAGAMTGEPGLAEEPSEFWTLLGVGALVQVLVGMVILKLAFKWADVHADWAQMFWPALAGMLGGAAVRAIGYAAWGVSEFFHLDDAVSYAALLFALMKTTHACTWQRAVGVAAASKLMSIVVWVFLSVALSRWLFA